MKPLSAFLHEHARVIHRLEPTSVERLNLDPAHLAPVRPLGDGSTIEITVEPEEALRLRPVPPVPAGGTVPLSVGFDSSTQSTVVGRRGGTVLVALKPLVVAAAGDTASLENDLTERVVWMALASDLYFKAPPDISGSLLFDHYQLQSNLENTLKHVKETTIVTKALSDTRVLLHRQGYRYDGQPGPRKVVLLKDGSVLSNKEYLIAGHLAGRRHVEGPELADARSLYLTIEDAATRQGLPVVGVTKDAQAVLLGALLDVAVPDYSLIRRLAREQGITGATLPPLRRRWQGSPLVVDYHFLFLERNCSCLRIEVISNLSLPGGVPWERVVQDVARMAIGNTSVLLDHHGMTYRLPEALARSDQQTREKAKDAKTVAWDVMEEFARNIPVSVELM